MAKTYVEGLRLVLQAAHKYGTRWQTKLESNLTGDQYSCLLSTLTAIAECLVLLGPQHINP
jgi:hypothetical protein